MVNSRRLGELLVRAGKIAPHQLETALEYQKSIGGHIGAILVKLGFVSEEEVVGQIAQQKNLAVVDLSEKMPDPEVVKSIPVEILEKHCVVPVKSEDGVLTVAMSNPEDFDAIEEIEFVSDSAVEVVLAPRTAIQRVINKTYYSSPEAAPKPPQAPAQPAPHPESEKTVSAFDIRRALIPLLIEKGVITEEELVRKARELS